MARTEASVVLSVVDRITAPIAAIQRRIDRLTAPVRRVARAIGDIGRAAGVDRLTSSVVGLGRRLGDVGSAARGVVAPMAALGGLAAAFGVKSLVQTNMAFEKYGSILETVLKSSSRAKDAMGWVSTFAAKTPYEIGEVMGAFVKLTTYGFDPMKGSLNAAGNAAAAMGKPLNQAVEALADAVTGENERLKEFGITAKKTGDKIVYTWTENGKQMTASAKANSREKIKAVIEGIWNRQYTGAMDKLSSTFGGMASNLSDQWARFMLTIGNAGAFDYMKGRLAALLDYVNGLADSGKMAEIGKQISDGIVSAMKSVEEAFRGVDWAGAWDGFRKGVEVAATIGATLFWLANLVGGPLQGAMLAIGAVTLAPLITALLALAPAILWVGQALLLTPVGWFLGAVAAIAAAAYLIIENWEPIKAFFVDMWDGLPEGFKGVITFFATVDKFFFDAGVAIVSSMWDGAKSLWSGFTEWLTGGLRGMLPQWALDKLGLNVTNGQAAAPYAPAGSQPVDLSGRQFGGVAGTQSTPSGPGAPGMAQSPYAPGGYTGMSPNDRNPMWKTSPAEPLGVPVIQAGAPDVNITSTANPVFNVEWSSLQQILSAVSAQLAAVEARQKAEIRSALGD